MNANNPQHPGSGTAHDLRAATSFGSADPSSSGKKRGGLLVAVAVLALLFSASAVAFSWRAADRADEAADRIESLVRNQPGVPGMPSSAPVPDVTTTEPPGPSPAGGGVGPEAGEPSAPPPTLNAQTQFTVRYTGKNLRLPASCNDYIYVDLDEPKVQVDLAPAEIVFHDPCGNAPQTWQLQNEARGSAAASEAVKPEECAELLPTSPLAFQEDLPLQRGNVYCITTSPNAPKTAGLTYKLIILTVTGISQDGVVALRASAWDIPST